MRYVWVLAAGSMFQLSAWAGPIIIDYTNALAAAALPQSVMDQVAQKRWFFAHASVGDYIMNGITTLHTANPNFYKLTHLTDDGTPPATTQPGVIYDYMRGNPGWQAKVDTFATYVANGWRAPNVDIVLNKFCWIDNGADVNYYISHTAALEAANPQTTFVYSTMPLDTTTGADNATRNLFNDALRAWVRANNRILYDIADMEAHDTSGLLQTYVYTNRTYQMLFPGYTSDGGHPTTAASQRMLALGFYALAAAMVNPDSDGDGMPDWWENANGLKPFDPTDASADPDQDGSSNLQEYLAGTDPHNAASVLRTRLSSYAGGQFRMEFLASSNVTYIVQYTSGTAPGPWTNLTTFASQPTNRTIVFVHSPSASNGLYRVAAQRNQ